MQILTWLKDYATGRIQVFEIANPAFPLSAIDEYVQESVAIPAPDIALLIFVLAF